MTFQTKLGAIHEAHHVANRRNGRVHVVTDDTGEGFHIISDSTLQLALEARLMDEAAFVAAHIITVHPRAERFAA